MPIRAGCRGFGERVVDGGIAQGVGVGDVAGDGRVGPARDDDAQPVWQVAGQQGSDAVAGAGRGHASVLVQPIDQEYEVASGGPRLGGGLLKAVLEPSVAGAVQVGVAQVGLQLGLEGGEEGRAVGAAGHAGGDEEPQHVHPVRWVEVKPSHQDGFSGPSGSQPPPVAAVRRRGGNREPRHGLQFRLTPLERGCLQGPDLQLVRGPRHSHPAGGQHAAPDADPVPVAGDDQVLIPTRVNGPRARQHRGDRAGDRIGEPMTSIGFRAGPVCCVGGEAGRIRAGLLPFPPPHG
ncbi:hypothetical protein [Streptomyces prasinus]|uniref:hypothetical protein n=1 Tax=Streptomyces prasinus TaxID=67345 RepID=UPI0033D95561